MKFFQTMCFDIYDTQKYPLQIVDNKVLKGNLQEITTRI